MKAVSVQHAVITPRGFQYDRAWMLVDAEGRFISQREIPELAIIDVRITGDDVRVSYKGSEINFKTFQVSEKEISTTVWRDSFTSREVNKEISDWFSDCLKKDLRLVTYHDRDYRIKKSKALSSPIEVSFADGYPYLIIGTASLQDLNSRLDSPVPMNRFRPNIVVNTETPFIEDNWKDVKCGHSRFQIVKPCARCVMTTIDQESTLRGKEPLYTLAKYRQAGKDILFGVNAISETGDIVKIGDAVNVLV